MAAGTALIEEKDISWVCCLFRFSFFCFSDDSEQKVNKGNLGNSKGGNCFFFPPWGRGYYVKCRWSFRLVLIDNWSEDNRGWGRLDDQGGI